MVAVISILPRNEAFDSVNYLRLHCLLNLGIRAICDFLTLTVGPLVMARDLTVLPQRSRTEYYVRTFLVSVTSQLSREQTFVELDAIVDIEIANSSQQRGR